MRFSDLPTTIANQKLRALMLMPGMANDIGIQAFNPMNKAVFLQKFYGAVSGRRLRLIKRLSQLCKDVIGADRRLAARNNLKHKTSRLGKAQTSLSAVCLNCFYKLMYFALFHRAPFCLWLMNHSILHTVKNIKLIVSGNQFQTPAQRHRVKRKHDRIFRLYLDNHIGTNMVVIRATCRKGPK